MKTNKNWGSGICNGVGWLFGRQRIRSGRSHSEEDAAEGYCHMKFPAIRQSTLSSDNPQVKSKAPAT